MLKNARAIKKWMKENGTKRPPRQNGEDIEENRLGSALSTIRQNLIKPYMKLKTEEERTKYKEDHPELEEVLEIVEEIDKNNPRRRQLNDLIEENSEKRKTLEQARGLEQGYRTELDNQKGNEAEQAKKGCGIGE